MWKKGFKFSRCIAGSLAIMMILEQEQIRLLQQTMFREVLKSV